MQNVLQIVYLIPLLPLIGFLINGLGRKRLSKPMVSIIGCGTILASFILSVWVFLEVKGGNTHVAEYFNLSLLVISRSRLPSKLISFLLYFF